YPNECCGVMLGRSSVPDGTPAGAPASAEIKDILRAVPLENVYDGGQADRYEIRPMDLLRVEREARVDGLVLLGIYHSHPDCDAYFSQTDLENSCPWYSFLVISIRQGEFHEANCFQPNADCSAAAPVGLEIPLAPAADLSPAKENHKQ
ncbi:MAG: M67 family metallopeptidase, partial [Bryobacterales bacterium]|nr:M67 family metallopeptidase [Bryobacterales bacterium]